MADFGPLGGVKITGFISPTDTNDSYAVIDPLYGIGGFRVLSGGTTDLDVIPQLRRRDGMVVGVSGGTSYYKLLPEGGGWSFTSADWELVPFGADTNFANTNLTFDNNRLHDLSGYTLTFSGGNIGVDKLVPTEKLDIDSGNIQLNNNFGLKIGTNVIDGGSGFFGPVNYLQMRTAANYSEPWFFMNGDGGTSFGKFIQFALGTQNNDIGTTFMKPGVNGGGVTSNNQLAILDNEGLYTNSNSMQRENATAFLLANGSTSSPVTGSVAVAASAVTMSQDWTLHTSRLNIIETPVLNPSITEILGRNSSTGNIEYINAGNITSDTFISGMTFNASNYDLTIHRNDGANFTESLSILSSDMVVTGGTYNILTGVVTFTNNSGGTFNVSGFTSGMTDSFTSTAYTIGNEIRFDNNVQGSNLYSVDLTPILSGTPYEYSGSTDIQPKLGNNSTGGGGGYSVISGGFNNTMNPLASSHFIGGGGYNTINDTTGTGYAVISGGYRNTANGGYSFIGAGNNNLISGSSSYNSAIIGGRSNKIYSNESAIIVGSDNIINGRRSIIGGGYGHTISGSNSFIGAGGSRSGGNNITSNESFIGAGGINTISGDTSFIGAGNSNQIGGSESFIGAGSSNLLNSRRSSIIGGNQNNILELGDNSFIGGGQANNINSNSVSIVGGFRNTISGQTYYSFIGAGRDNTINGNGYFSFIGGGQANNINSSPHSSIIGGNNNTISGHSNSHIIGSNITSISANTTHVERLNIGLADSGLTTDMLLVLSTDGMVKTINSIGANFGNTYFVAPEGDDISGTRGDILRPFQTLSAARNKAVDEITGNTVSGDTLIYVFPGSYIDEEIQYDNGNYYFSPGAEVTAIARDSSASGISGTTSLFHIGSTPPHYPQYSATTCNIFGQGTFKMPISLDNDWNGTLCLVNGSGETYFECHEMFIQQGVGVGLRGFGKATFRGNFLGVEESGYVATVRDSSSSVFDFRRIYDNGIGWPFFIRHGDQDGFYGDCVVNADRITAASGWQPIAALRLRPGSSLIVNCPNIISEDNYALNHQQSTGGDIIINGNLFGNKALISNSNLGGTLTINGNSECVSTAIEMNSANDLNTKVIINGDIKILSGATQAIALNDGILRLNGSIENYDSSGSGTTYNGINITGVGRLIIDTCKIITDNESITSSAPRDIKVIHSLASNKGLNTNITNLITGSNIIIDSDVE